VGAPGVDRGTTCVPAERTPFEILDRGAARAFAAAPLAARFAIETALGDAIARDRGMSLAALFAAHVGVPSRVPLAAVVDDAEAARRAWAAGIRCLKIKLGADDDLDRVIAIARAAPGATLRIDANRSWPRGDVAARLAALAPLRVEYVEEPCRDAHELLRSGPLACKLALDESLSELSLEDLRAALGSPGLAAVILKPTLLGGLSVALELAALARRAGVAAVASHALEGPIGTAACAELALALGGEHAAGLARHAGLAGWSVEVAQLADDHLRHAAAAGLGFGFDLDGAVGACRTRMVGDGGDLP
jgi:L-alanine-DL-glutamate epimerase-like enolase superfamily enzyme